MALTIPNKWTPYEGTVSQQVHTLAAAPIGSGANRKAVAWVTVDNTAVLSSMTFNGAAMTLVRGKVHSVSASIQAYLYRYDIPDALAAGNYDVAATMSASTPNNVSIGGWQLLGAALGAEEDDDDTEALDGVGTALSVTLTCTDGAGILAVAQNGSAVPTWSWSAAVTEDNDNDESNYSSTSASGIASGAGDKTATATTSTTTGPRVHVAASFAAAVGPTITTQPTDETVVLNDETQEPPAEFLMEYTLSGAYVGSSVEVNDGGGWDPLTISGIYALVDDEMGDLVFSIAPTTLAQNGYDYRITIEDGNGATVSDTVTLTVKQGPVSSTTIGPTDVGGDAAGTQSSDDVLDTVAGRILVTEYTVGEVILYLHTRPSSVASAALTGTAGNGVTVAELITGGQTLIITLTNAIFARGTVFNAARQAIIDGCIGDGDEEFGWNNYVREEIDVANVVRTSDTVVTITLDAAALTALASPEAVTITLPAVATNRAAALGVTPAFTISLA